jgi:chromosome segregation ATPase
MDIESFQNVSLNHLDFTDEAPNPPKIAKTSKAATGYSVEHIPLPDEMPMAFNTSSVPKDILKSSTVENLISQNDDLMTRLKVALRRLSTLESENHKLADVAQKAKLSQAAVADQMMIFKEKDQLWKQKLTQAEKEKDLHVEKTRALQEKVEKLANEVERYHKYHDRIKTQVKPYIQQLKEYSHSLEKKSEALLQSQARSDAQISDLRFQIVEVTKNSRLQIELREKSTHEMVQQYELQIQNQTTELRRLEESHKELEVKALRLNKALEKQDALENQLVEMMRSKEELKTRSEQEVLRLQDRASELHRANTRLELEHNDLRDLAMSNEMTIKDLRKENQDLTQQLDSLRYMWNAKIEENEKARAALQSLERLNVELSQKVNELRSAQIDED